MSIASKIRSSNDMMGQSQLLVLTIHQSMRIVQDCSMKAIYKHKFFTKLFLGN